MSGIFGILNLDGQPVAREHLDAMRDSMAYWGPDGSSVWQEGHVGLGHLMLFNTPEARCESLPLRHSASGVVLTAHARIDNRDELISDLGLTATESAIPDGELILRSYLRWGEECVQHMIGDWAFAAWDLRQRKLFLARDHYGISGIYYYHQPRFFAFASAIKGLLALPQVPQRPDLFNVAQVLTWWHGDGLQTAYEEIVRLPPAHTLTVTTDKVEVRRYWSPENLPPLRLKSDEEYVQAFLEVYTEAVRCRLPTPPIPSPASGGGDKGVGATLSSGLDSGSVCALAARELRARGERLPVFTSVPLYLTEGLTGPNRYGDESPLVEADRQFIGNLDVHYIRAENVSPLAGMEHHLELHDSPTPGARNTFWLYSLLHAAQQQGLGVLLTGQCGNGSISWPGTIENFWPLILTGEWQTLCRKAKRSGLSPWKAIWLHLLRPVAQETRRVFRNAPGLLREPWAVYSAISLPFARSLDLTRRMAAGGYGPTFTPPADPLQSHLHFIQPGADIIGAVWAETGHAYGLEVRDPTMDKRLMEFCLAIPDEQYRLNGQDRALIRRAMKGLLPDEVRLNTRRSLQTADLGHRLIATLPEMQAMMARLEQSVLAREVLDLPKMKRVLQALQKEVNATTNEQCGNILMPGMMAGMFLLRF